MAYLANEVLSTEFFTILRTREQFGYFVRSSLHTSNPVLGLQFVVYSAVKPSVIFNRIMKFLNERIDYIEKEMKIEELSTHLSSIQHRLLKKSDNLLSELEKLGQGILLERNFFLGKITNYVNYFS